MTLSSPTLDTRTSVGTVTRAAIETTMTLLLLYPQETLQQWPRRPECRPPRPRKNLSPAQFAGRSPANRRTQFQRLVLLGGALRGAAKNPLGGQRHLPLEKAAQVVYVE